MVLYILRRLHVGANAVSRFYWIIHEQALGLIWRSEKYDTRAMALFHHDRLQCYTTSFAIHVLLLPTPRDVIDPLQFMRGQSRTF